MPVYPAQAIRLSLFGPGPNGPGFLALGPNGPGFLALGPNGCFLMRTKIFATVNWRGRKDEQFPPTYQARQKAIPEDISHG